MAKGDSLDMLLIGRAGNGKSTTGNTILDRVSFHSACDTESTTESAEYDYSEFEGNTLKVVDCPGLGDTRLGIDLDVRQLSCAIGKAVENNPEGFHAIVYIAKFGNRIDNYDVQALQTIKDLVGENFIKNHCIIVMTGGDNFENDPAITQEEDAFDKWVKRQKNKHFNIILQECKGRIILFDNRTDDACKKKSQKRKLVEIIVSIKINNEGKRYTNADFEKAGVMRTKLFKKLHAQQEIHNYFDAIGILTSRLKNVTHDEENCYITFGEVEQESVALRHRVVMAGKKNNKLCVIAFELSELFSQALKAKRNELFRGPIDMKDEMSKRNTRSRFDELEQKYLQYKISNTYF